MANVTAHAPLEGLCYMAIAAAQGGCLAVTKAVSSPSLWIQNIAGAEVICDVSSGGARPVVPAAFQRTVFAAVHRLAHPGIRATRRMISCRFLYGTAALQMCLGGAETARSASAARSPGSWRRRHRRYLYQRSGSATCMWI